MNLQSKLFWDVIALIWIGGMLGSTFLAARSWYLEAKYRFSLEAPRWRSVLALAGLAMASISVLLVPIALLTGLARGGFPYYDPLLMRFFGNGLLSAAAAVLFGSVGKGRARWPSLGIGLFIGFFWFITASME